MTEKDVRDLHVLRCALETLAIRLAAQTVNEQDRLAMPARMADLERAAAIGDHCQWTRCDLALHRSIWQASGNPHLLKILDSVLGAIFIMADRVKARRDLDVTLEVKYHRDLVDLVSAGKTNQASAEMNQHMTRSLNYSLETFQLSKPESDLAR